MGTGIVWAWTGWCTGWSWSYASLYTKAFLILSRLMRRMFLLYST